MTTDSVVNVTVFQNDGVLKNIKQQITLNTKNWTDYKKSLKTIQKDVNNYLTELVEEEKSRGEDTNAEEECADSDDDDEEAESMKRKLGSTDKKSRKKAKT